MTAPLAVPTIHSNGTAFKVLVEQVEKVLWNLEDTLRAMDAAEPHGRDYYPQGDAAYPQARKEHVARVEAIRAVREELYTLRDAIYARPHKEE